jgi:hypothetical protein
LDGKKGLKIRKREREKQQMKQLNRMSFLFVGQWWRKCMNKLKAAIFEGMGKKLELKKAIFCYFFA